MAPIAEDVGLTWRDDDAYDHWEALGESLFDILVVSAIAGDLEVGRDRRAVGRYGVRSVPRGFKPGSCIEVDIPEREGTFAFLRFGSANDFGVMDVVHVDASGYWTEDVQTVAWAPARTFSVRLRETGSTDRRIDRVTPAEPGWPIGRREY